MNQYIFEIIPDSLISYQTLLANTIVTAVNNSHPGELHLLDEYESATLNPFDKKAEFDWIKRWNDPESFKKHKMSD